MVRRSKSSASSVPAGAVRRRDGTGRGSPGTCRGRPTRGPWWGTGSCRGRAASVRGRDQRAAGDDGMDMDVPAEVLSPRVQHHGDAGLPAEPAWIAPELEQRLGGGLEQQAVDERGLAPGEGVEFVRQGEHDMPVADVEELVALALDPAGLRERLALGTVAVPAGRVLNGDRPAGVAPRREAAEGRRCGNGPARSPPGVAAARAGASRDSGRAGARRMSATSRAGRVTGAEWQATCISQAPRAFGNSGKSRGDGVAWTLSCARCR